MAIRKWHALVVLALAVVLLSLAVGAAHARTPFNGNSTIGAIYFRGTRVQIYSVDANSKGTFALEVTTRDVRRVTRENPTVNTLIKASDDGRVAMYLLSTGEFQVNMGPNPEGKVEVVIWKGIPPETAPFITYFNVFDILGV